MVTILIKRKRFWWWFGLISSQSEPTSESHLGTTCPSLSWPVLKKYEERRGWTVTIWWKRVIMVLYWRPDLPPTGQKGQRARGIGRTLRWWASLMDLGIRIFGANKYGSVYFDEFERFLTCRCWRLATILEDGSALLNVVACAQKVFIDAAFQ